MPACARLFRTGCERLFQSALCSSRIRRSCLTALRCLHPSFSACYLHSLNLTRIKAERKTDSLEKYLPEEIQNPTPNARLKIYRIMCNMTLDELTYRTGIKKKYLMAIESNTRQMTTAQRDKIAEAACYITFRPLYAVRCPVRWFALYRCLIHVSDWSDSSFRTASC